MHINNNYFPTMYYFFKYLQNKRTGISKIISIFLFNPFFFLKKRVKRTLLFVILIVLGGSTLVSSTTNSSKSPNSSSNSDDMLLLVLIEEACPESLDGVSGGVAQQ